MICYVQIYTVENELSIFRMHNSLGSKHLNKNYCKSDSFIRFVQIIGADYLYRGTQHFRLFSIIVGDRGRKCTVHTEKHYCKNHNKNLHPNRSEIHDKIFPSNLHGKAKLISSENFQLET